jgi:DNA-binding CsgD family transcriptional regulator
VLAGACSLSQVGTRKASGVLPDFESSFVPMLIADNERRYVQANPAVCLLLRLDLKAVLQKRIDDLTTPEHLSAMEASWAEFQQDGVQSGTFELLMPDGPRLRVDYSATANVTPGRHLAIFVLPAANHDVLAAHAEREHLSERERQVLSLVAMGENGTRIAETLGISPSTVETHIRHCLTKLEAKNRAHAIAVGLHRGEIAMTFPEVLS